MKASELHSEIVSFCKSNTNEDIIRKYSRYFKEGQWDAYGLTQDLLQNKIKEILAREDINFKIIRETSAILVRSSKYEETSFAILLYKSQKKYFNPQFFKDITLWFETGVSNWAQCDSICGELMSELLLKDIISYKDLKPWISADSKFQRRAVPVSMIKLLKVTDDYTQFYKIIEPLMTDNEREVHQGTGWFLREAWKKQKIQTESFLMKWKEISPRLIFQYACEKMTPEEKIRFRRPKQP